MKKRKALLTIGIIVAVIAISIAICYLTMVVESVEDETLRWTMIGALGSWAGSIFGAIALVISIIALLLPQKVKIEASISTGMLIPQIHGIDRIDTYLVTVKNTGMRATTINNIYLNFGGRNGVGDIFVGMLNQNSLLQAVTPVFPKRLDQGEAFDYYLLREKLIAGLEHYEDKTPRDTPLYIRVDEVTNGTRYYKTKWTLGTFIGNRK